MNLASSPEGMHRYGPIRRGTASGAIPSPALARPKLLDQLREGIRAETPELTAHPMLPLAEEVRMKLKGPLMHLKSYLVYGKTLRTGATKFMASDLKH